MRIYLSAVALLCVASLACRAPAQSCGQAKQQTAAKSDGSVCHKDKSTCAKGEQTAGRAKLLAASGAPLMLFKVGDQTTCCPKQAGEWTNEKRDVPVRYVVEYTDQAAALQAYQAALEDHLAQLTAVRYAVGDQCVGCPKEAASLAQQTGGTVKYRVASFTFADAAQADRAAEAARAAADKPKMTYVVDGKEYVCNQEAKQSCQAKAGEAAAKTCEYKVGEMKTCCETTAKIELTSARIIAAYQALALAADEKPHETAEVHTVAAGS